MPRVDAWSKDALAVSGKIRLVACNGLEVQRTNLSCSVQSFVAVTEAHVAQLLQGTPPARQVRVACLLQAQLRVCRSALDLRSLACL